MIQMDANTRKVGKETETSSWEIAYIVIRRFYITFLRGRFFILFYFLRTVNSSGILT